MPENSSENKSLISTTNISRRSALQAIGSAALAILGHKLIHQPSVVEGVVGHKETKIDSEIKMFFEDIDGVTHENLENLSSDLITLGKKYTDYGISELYPGVFNKIIWDSETVQSVNLLHRLKEEYKILKFDGKLTNHLKAYYEDVFYDVGSSLWFTNFVGQELTKDGKEEFVKFVEANQNTLLTPETIVPKMDPKVEKIIKARNSLSTDWVEGEINKYSLLHWSFQSNFQTQTLAARMISLTPMYLSLSFGKDSLFGYVPDPSQTLRPAPAQLLFEGESREMVEEILQKHNLDRVVTAFSLHDDKYLGGMFHPDEREITLQRDTMENGTDIAKEHLVCHESVHAVDLLIHRVDGYTTRANLLAQRSEVLSLLSTYFNIQRVIAPGDSSQKPIYMGVKDIGLGNLTRYASDTFTNRLLVVPETGLVDGKTGMPPFNFLKVNPNNHIPEATVTFEGYIKWFKQKIERNEYKLTQVENRIFDYVEDQSNISANSSQLQIADINYWHGVLQEVIIPIVFAKFTVENTDQMIKDLSATDSPETIIAVQKYARNVRTLIRNADIELFADVFATTLVQKSYPSEITIFPSIDSTVWEKVEGMANDVLQTLIDLGMAFKETPTSSHYT